MASAKLSRTTAAPTSADIGTVSFWLKRSAIDQNNHYIISNYTDGSNYGYIRFKSGDQLQAYGTQSNDEKRTNRVFRDTSAWYHIVLRVDTTQGTAADRVRLYINGVQETSFSTNTNVSQNTDYDLFKSGGTMIIGHIQSGTATYLDGQLSHFHYADGQSYAPTVFGETDATTGTWKPKTNPGISQANYGNNGFFLKFDNSANMGLDSSGNSHNLTTSGTIIQTKDTPANVFATFNALEPTSNLTFSNINNTLTSGAGSKGVPSTLAVSSGKFYFENKLGSSAGNVVTGIAQDNSFTYVGSSSTSYGHYNGNIYNSGSTTSYGGSASNNDIVGIGLDLDNNKMYVSINGTWQNSANPSSGTGGHTINAGTYHFAASGDNSQSWNANFGNGYFGTTIVSSAQNPDDGNGIFEYDPPTGYRALCTKSINAEEYS